MENWKQIDGVLSRTRSFVVEGRLHSGEKSSPKTDFWVEVPEDGGLPISVEGTLSRSSWNALTHPLPNRRLRFGARNGPTNWESNDVLPDGARQSGSGRVQFGLRLNNLLETTKFSTQGRDTTVGGVCFGHLPLVSPSYDGGTDRISKGGVRLKAAGWHVKLAPTLGYPRTAPGVDGLVLPARVSLSLRSERLTQLAKRSRKEALTLVREIGETAAAILSVLVLRRCPWIHAETIIVRRGRGEHRRFSRPAILQAGNGRRSPLTHQGEFRQAFGPALRALLRLRDNAPRCAETLVEAMFLFASAAEDDDLRRSWSSLSLCLDLLGGREELRARRSQQTRQQLAVERKELKSLVAVSRAESVSKGTIKHLSYAVQNVDRVSYRDGIEAVARKARVEMTPLGGSDFLRDIVDIRNALMHRGSLSNRKLREIQKRGAKRGLGFPEGDLPRVRIGLQVMHDRHSAALRLAAQLLLRILQVPDRVAPFLWDARSMGGPF